MWKAERMLYTDRVLHADILEAMRRGTAQLLYDSEHTLLIRETESGTLFLTAEDMAEGKAVLDRWADAGVLAVRKDALAEYACRLGYRKELVCWQVLYDSQKPLPVNGRLKIRHPEPELFPRIRENYNLVDEQTLWEDFTREDFLGAYLEDGTMVGFIGVHAEGAMGLLEIFPEYRCQGFAQELYSCLINRQLVMGRLPYAQVACGNVKSIGLQRKLGLTFSDGYIYWMYK